MPICDSCWAEFPALDESVDGPGCARCGDSLESFHSADGASLCRACRVAPPDFERAVAFGLYEGRMKEAIHALKYDRLHAAARPLGRMLAAAIAKLAADAPEELLVVPIPLHRSRYAQRGFNQARALAREAIASLHGTHPQWRLTLAPSTLMRLRATESQAGLTPRQRRLNVRGAFSVADDAAIKGKHVLLIDDILTTGATARAAARTLKRGGAESVWVATLARARRVTAFPLQILNEDQEQDTSHELPQSAHSSIPFLTSGQPPF